MTRYSIKLHDMQIDSMRKLIQRWLIMPKLDNEILSKI